MSASKVTPRELLFPADTAHRTAKIQPAQFTAVRLMSELADAWVDYYNVIGVSTGTAVGHASIIRNAGLFLSLESDRHLSLTSSSGKIVSRLHDWELSLLERYPPPSSRPKKLGRTLRRLIAYYLESREVENELLARWTSSPIHDGAAPRERPLNEFSNPERLALENACKSIIRATEARLSLGRSWLEQGRDPRVDGWSSPANALWALRHLPYKESYRDRLSGQHADLKYADLMDQISKDDGATPARPSTITTGLAQLLVPNDEYLMAVRILLHLATGWVPEESKTLTRKDVIFSDKHVEVRATKNRAQRIKAYTLATEKGRSPGWGAGDLFRRAAFAMENAYAMTDDPNPFWISGAGAGGRRSHGTPRTEGYPGLRIRKCQFIGSGSFKSLILRHELAISEPHDLRRLRKTVKSARAALIGTFSGAAGDDHTLEVFRGHYTHTTTVKVIAAQTVLRAQNKVLHRATSGPTFVDAEARTVAMTSEQPALRSIARAVANEEEREKELTVAACSDPYSPPHATTNGLCLEAPSMCLQCPNAIVFHDHLPRLITRHQDLSDRRRSMPPPQFHEIYGQQLVNLETVINAFPAAAVEQAQAAHAHVHQPLRDREQH